MGVQAVDTKRVRRIIFGGDFGNATVCGVAVDPETGATIGEARFSSLQTVTGRGSLREALGGRRQLDKDEHVITTSKDGVPFTTYVGKLAEMYPQDADIARGGEKRYTNGWTINLALAAIASLVPDADEIHVDLRTGVPPKILENSPEIADEITTLYKRRWSFNYNGRDVSVIFTDVTVMAEGYGAWLTLTEEERTGSTLVIDLGGGTINLVVVLQNGHIYQSLTFPGRGNEFVFDNVNTAIIHNGGRALLPQERRELQEALVAGKSYTISINGKQIDVTKPARVYVDQNAEKLLQAIHSHIPHIEAYNRVRLTGGTAYNGLSGAKLIAAIPNSARISDTPEMDNARGYAGAERKSKKRR